MIAVTGAGGHLGQWVVAELARRGADVLAISRRPAGCPSIGGISWARPVRTFAVDLAAADAAGRLRPALAGVEAVVHLAAHVPVDTAPSDAAGAAATLAANVAGTIRLLDALAAAPRLRTVVLASTDEVYGAPRALPLAEDHPTLPRTLHGAGKLTSEKHLALFSADRGVPGSALRFPAIWGPGDRTRRDVGDFARAAACGADLLVEGDGADRRDLVHAADAAVAVARAVERAPRGPINVGSGRGYTVLEIAEAARAASGGTARIVFRERVKERVDVVLDAARALSLLGWAPAVELEAGLRDWIDRLRGGGAAGGAAGLRKGPA